MSILMKFGPMNKQLNLNIAGISIGILAAKIEYLDSLEKFYQGFLSDKAKSDFYITIQDKPVENRAPGTVLVSLKKKNSGFSIISKSLKSYILGDIYPSENKGDYYQKYIFFVIPFFDSFLRTCVQLILEKKGGAILHASAVNFVGKGYVFSGPPNIGKTTIVNLKNGLDIVAEDCATISRQNGSFYIYETPWSGKQNRSVKLDKIFFLKKYKRLKFQRLNRANALLETTSNADMDIFGKEQYEKAFQNLENLVKETSCYNLYFSLTSRVWDRIPKLDQRG